MYQRSQAISREILGFHGIRKGFQGIEDDLKWVFKGDLTGLKRILQLESLTLP